MSANVYIMDVNRGGQPFNVRMVLSLAQLQLVMPLIKDQLMRGLADNDKDGNVILHLQLNEEIIAAVEDLLVTTYGAKSRTTLNN